MRTTLVIWLLFSVTPGMAHATSIAIEGPKSFKNALAIQLQKEASDFKLAADGTRADVTVQIQTEDQTLVLSVLVGRRVVQSRRLGRADQPEVAVRRALIILVEILDASWQLAPELPSSTSATTAAARRPPSRARRSRPRASPASVSARPPPKRETRLAPKPEPPTAINPTKSATISVSEPPVAPTKSATISAAKMGPGQTSSVSPQYQAHWTLEGGLAVATWSTPFAFRWGLTAAGHYRNEGWQLGLRVTVNGLCCTISAESVDINARTGAALIEGRLRLIPGSFSGWLVGAGGVEGHFVTATVVDLFQGPAAPETGTLWTPAGRLGLRGEARLLDRLILGIQMGVEARGRVLSVNLPSPYDEGREPPSLSRWGGFLEIGLSGEVF